MNGQEEVDEFGIPIKKKAPEKKQEVDEFGIPIKKKDATGTPSGTGSKTPSISKLPYAKVKTKIGEYDNQIKTIEKEINTKYGNIKAHLFLTISN